MIKKLTLLVSLALLPLTTLFAKSTADFSGLKGNYTGTTLFTYTGIPAPVSGPVTINVAVPRNGRSAVATISGSLSLGSIVPFSGTLTMTKSTLTGSDVLFNLITANIPFTIPGKLSKNGFKASGSTSVSSPPVPVFIQSTAKVKPKGKKKKKITITYVLSASGSSYSFVFTATGKVRKN